MITWASGHLVTLKEPHEYTDERKRWNLATLPMLPARYKLKVVETAKKQFSIIQKLLISKDFVTVVNHKIGI